MTLSRMIIMILCGGLLLVPAELPAEEWKKASGAAESKAPPGVGIANKLGNTLPGDLTFTDHLNQKVSLGDYFEQDDRPIIFNMVYYKCWDKCLPMLELEIDVLRQIKGLELGRDYRMLAVSIDPKESPALALRTRRRFMDQYYGKNNANRPEDNGKDWVFLVGTDPGNREDPNIDLLSDAAGFSYTLNKGWGGEYNHGIVTMVLNPKGTISRYLMGWPGSDFKVTDLKLAILDASEGKVGSWTDHMIAKFCYSYNAAEGKYTVMAKRLLSVAALVVLITLASVVTFFLRMEKKRKLAWDHSNQGGEA